jgi:hypothetical protein
MKTATLILIIIAAALAQVLAFVAVTMINRSRTRRDKTEKEDA